MSYNKADFFKSRGFYKKVNPNYKDRKKYNIYVVYHDDMDNHTLDVLGACISAYTADEFMAAMISRYSDKQENTCYTFTTRHLAHVSKFVTNADVHSSFHRHITSVYSTYPLMPDMPLYVFCKYYVEDNECSVNILKVYLDYDEAQTRLQKEAKSLRSYGYSVIMDKKTDSAQAKHKTNICAKVKYMKIFKVKLC